MISDPTPTVLARALRSYAASGKQAPADLLRAAANVLSGWRRSDEEHNLLFGVIAMAFDNWPVQHAFRPVDEEHLRAWLAMEVGHCEVMTVPSDCALDARALALVGEFFAGGKRHFRIGKIDGQLVVMRPLTMAKRGIPVRVWRTMAANVYGVVEAETGITPDTYRAVQQEAREAAA